MIAQITYFLEQDNYGQRLQAYALQRFIEREFGEKVYAVDYDEERRGVNLGDGRHFHAFERDCMNLFRLDDIKPGALDGFDKVVVGGDQMLNAEWDVPGKVMPRLVMCKSGRKKDVFMYGVGLAPKQRAPWKVIGAIGSRIRAYGLRERCADIDHTWTIDPVFLIKDEWDDLSTVSIDPGATVEYFVERGHTVRLAAVSGAGEVIVDSKAMGRVLDPREFVGMFRGAARIRTNSFHGMAFALLNRIPVIEMSDWSDHRVKELLEILDAKVVSRKVVNYDEVHANIDREIRRARDFLEMCLSPSPSEYCAYSKDKAIRDASTSGGAAAEAAKAVYAMGGTVIGAAFSDDFRKVLPTEAKTMDEYLRKLSKSKYSFCGMPDMGRLQGMLDSGAVVMYVGSPCHVRVVSSMFGERYPNLICADFRCRGYSNSTKLGELVDELESRGDKVVGIDFRPNHKSDAMSIRMASGAMAEKGADVWNRFVHDSLPMCRRCPFAHGSITTSDITFADFWNNLNDRMGIGPEFTPERGCSLVRVNTEKGAGIWNSMKCGMEYMAIS